MSIKIFFEGVRPLKIKKKILKKRVNYLINNEIKKPGALSFIFCSDNYLLEMNINYLNHNYFTDIITFNYVKENTIAGDLFISIERVGENAKTFNNSFLKELYRVVFHGVLHLIGYNDKTEEEKKVMREKEDFYLSEVDFKEAEL